MLEMIRAAGWTSPPGFGEGSGRLAERSEKQRASV